MEKGGKRMLSMLLESILLAASCSLDAFAASFAYGTKGIKIPAVSNLIVSAIASLFLGIALLVGTFSRQYFSDWLTTGIAFCVLFFIGFIKFLDGIIKAMILRYNKLHKELFSKEFKLSMFGVGFMLHLMANPEKADINENNIISPVEAALLGVSLSIDGLAVGFGAALGNANATAVVIATLVAGVLMIDCGCRMGNRLARTLKFNVSWVSGVILMGLAVSKLF